MGARTATTIHSMTGYGRASARTAIGQIAVELRSTNHRFLEIDHRMPNGLAGVQARMAETIRRHVKRGRVEVTLAANLERGGHRRVQFDATLLARYHDTLRTIKRRFKLTEGIALAELISLPHAITIVEEPLQLEDLWASVRQVVERAATDLATSRAREGKKLVEDLHRQIRAIRGHAAAIRRRLPKALAGQRKQLQRRLREVLGGAPTLSSSQLEQAAALVKDIDVHEELVRLDTHLTYMEHTLAEGGLVGKRLDFIAQELMRETNTTGSKVNDPQAAQHVVEIKGCIEKIREQVQNLE